MRATYDFDYYRYRILASPAFQQLAPFVILFAVPALVLALHSRRHFFRYIVFMVLESLAVVLPWNWSDAFSSSQSPERRKLKRKHIRSREEKIPLAGRQGDSDSGTGEEGYYPGLVNISGTYCFMDSTLQALASLAYLQPQLDEIHAKAEALDVPTPVIDALRDLLKTLNTPMSSPRALRPREIIDALSKHKHSSLFSSREHQDAQELFQLISESVKIETTAVDKESYRDRGLGGLAQKDGGKSREIGKTVFDGLTANRRSCMECGYTEAVMHFAFDNWQLSLPRMAAACRIEDCLDDYTRLELLNDCICRKCSMLATMRRLQEEADKQTESAQATTDHSSSKKKRARDSRKLLARVKAALADGRIEEDIKGVKLDKVFSPGSTKQAMVARPPPVLALHLNRSVHYGNYASKNNCRVIFHEILDLTPYTTSGRLSTLPSAPISTPPPLPQRSATPTPSSHTPRTLYLLSAVVCHYGQHSFGHYVCFRRKPRPRSAGSRRFAPPRLACPLGCACERCERDGPIRVEDVARPGTGRGWLRISDDSVNECGIESVLQEGSGAFMLYYERIQPPKAHPPPATGTTPRSSEETVRGEGSLGARAAASVDPNGVAKPDQAARHAHEVAHDERVREKARIVRNVSMPRLKAPAAMSRTESASTVQTQASSSTVVDKPAAGAPNGSTSHRERAHPHTNGVAHRAVSPPPAAIPSPPQPVRTSSSGSGTARLRKPRKDSHPVPPSDEPPRTASSVPLKT